MTKTGLRRIKPEAVELEAASVSATTAAPFSSLILPTAHLPPLAPSCCPHQVQIPDTCLQNSNQCSSDLPELPHSGLCSLPLTTLCPGAAPDTATTARP